MRIDIALHSTDQPIEPGALAIDSETITHVVQAVSGWRTAAQGLRALWVDLPVLIGDLMNLLGEALRQLAGMLASRGISALGAVIQAARAEQK